MADTMPVGTEKCMQALAQQIAAAVATDEAGDGCDLSAGLFGTEMTALIRGLTIQQLHNLRELHEQRDELETIRGSAQYLANVEDAIKRAGYKVVFSESDLSDMRLDEDDTPVEIAPQMALPKWVVSQSDRIARYMEKQFGKPWALGKLRSR